MYWQRFFVWVLDELFPQFCLGCQREGLQACGPCLQKLKQSPGHLELDGLLVTYVYEYHNAGVGKYIEAWKYHGAEHYMRDWFEVIEAPKLAGFDGIVPVPLHRRRLAERGFNQSERIALFLANKLNTKVMQALLRQRYTKPQAQCEAQERRSNLARAFVLAPKLDVRGKRLLLVDDVVTTGTTLLECSAVLLGAGAKEVQAFCLARGGSQIA